MDTEMTEAGEVTADANSHPAVSDDVHMEEESSAAEAQNLEVHVNSEPELFASKEVTLSG